MDDQPSAPALPELPFERDDPLAPPPRYGELRATAPVTRVRTQAGDLAWLVTGYEEARQALTEPRLRRSAVDPATAPRISDALLIGGPDGDAASEKARHERMRRLLAPAFSARRMNALRPRVQELTDGLMDRLAGLTPPVDLREELSLPLPILVICELLGVPYADQAYFRKLAEAMGDFTDTARSGAAFTELRTYTWGIVEEKRERPTEDVFSDLASMKAPQDEVAILAAGLLFAGHETTVSSIDYGVLLLLEHPEQRDALVADPARVDRVVEEIMRVAAPSRHGIPRWAHDDVRVGEVTVRRGEAVVIVPVAANRDGRTFPDADRFDVTRPATDPHIAFGHGAHHCLGASLARVELRAVFSTLFTRFPTLRLAIPRADLRERTTSFTGGVTALPVTW